MPAGLAIAIGRTLTDAIGAVDLAARATDQKVVILGGDVGIRLQLARGSRDRRTPARRAGRIGQGGCDDLLESGCVEVEHRRCLLRRGAQLVSAPAIVLLLGGDL